MVHPPHDPARLEPKRARPPDRERPSSAPRQGADELRPDLAHPQSDLAHELLKDPYAFDFLTLDAEAREREIERGLVEHIRDFLLELGSGFAFVGSLVGGEDYYLDLLFYHLELRSYLVIELKARAFEPEYVGKLNFYLSAVDDLLSHAGDQPTIALILCKTRNRVIAEYALRDTTKPMRIATYELTQALPEHLKASLPTIEELEAELSQEAETTGKRDDDGQEPDR